MKQIKQIYKISRFSPDKYINNKSQRGRQKKKKKNRIHKLVLNALEYGGDENPHSLRALQP